MLYKVGTQLFSVCVDAISKYISKRFYFSQQECYSLEIKLSKDRDPDIVRPEHQMVVVTVRFDDCVDKPIVLPYYRRKIRLFPGSERILQKFSAPQRVPVHAPPGLG